METLKCLTSLKDKNFKRQSYFESDTTFIAVCSHYILKMKLISFKIKEI